MILSKNMFTENDPSANLPVEKPINPFSLSDHYVERPPEELKKLIELAADANNELSDIDVAMGWPVGTTVQKIRRYPLLKQTINEARILAMKKAGLSKADCYVKYKDLMSAQRPIVAEGEIVDNVDDNEVQLKATDRVMTLFGEKPVGGSGVNVAVGVQVNGGMSERERELLEAYRRG